MEWSSVQPPIAKIDYATGGPTESNLFIIDVEGFQLSKDFFVKELAVFNPVTENSWVGLFKPPFESLYLKKKGLQCINYCTDNFHGLKWDQGEFPYSAIYPMISHFANNATLYAKGQQKCAWLRQFTSAPVIDLETLGCPPAKELPHACLCMNHNTLFKTCAMDKAIRLGRYLVHMYDMQPIVNIPKMSVTPSSSPLL